MGFTKPRKLEIDAMVDIEARPASKQVTSVGRKTPKEDAMPSQKSKKEYFPIFVIMITGRNFFLMVTIITETLKEAATTDQARKPPSVRVTEQPDKIGKTDSNTVCAKKSYLLYGFRFCTQGYVIQRGSISYQKSIFAKIPARNPIVECVKKKV